MNSNMRKKLNQIKSQKIYEQIISDIEGASVVNSLPKYDFSVSPKSEFTEFDHDSINAALDLVYSFISELEKTTNKFYVSFCSTEINEAYWIELKRFTKGFLEKAIKHLTSLEYIIADDQLKPVLLFLEEEYTYRVYTHNLIPVIEVS